MSLQHKPPELHVTFLPPPHTITHCPPSSPTPSLSSLLSHTITVLPPPPHQKANVSIVDHHSATESFMTHMKAEVGQTGATACLELHDACMTRYCAVQLQVSGARLGITVVLLLIVMGALGMCSALLSVMPPCADPISWRLSRRLGVDCTPHLW